MYESTQPPRTSQSANERITELEVTVASLTLQVRALLQSQLQMAETSQLTAEAVVDLSTSFRKHMRAEAVQLVLDDLDGLPEPFPEFAEFERES